MFSDAGQLIVQEGHDVVQTVPLSMPVLTIGRAPDNQVTLSDAEVSRHHAEVRLQSAGPMLTDLDSANGTYLGDVRLLAHQPHLLVDGATFRIGPYTITYQASVRTELTEQTSLQTELTEQETALLAGAPPDQPEPPKPESPKPEPAPVQVAAQALPAPPRPTSPAPLACGPISSYLRDLPVIFQENDYLGRFLLIFESIWEPLEQRQDHVALYFDPHTCPASFLPWLASWLDLSLKAHWPEMRRRRLLAEALDLYRWRGTAYGLARIIEVCTGLTPEITEAPSQPFVFTVRITVPPGSSVDKDLIEDLIKEHKPAYAGYRLALGP